jgi:hypothetical protein
MAKLLFLVVELALLGLSGAFGVISNGSIRRDQSKILASSKDSFEAGADFGDSRRSFLTQASLLSTALLVSSSSSAGAAVGTLPELANANAYLQGVTIRVADQSQQSSTIAFFTDAFDFKVLRKNGRRDLVRIWTGTG